MGMNQFKTKRYHAQPKNYTEDDIDDILHNANIEKTFGTNIKNRCQVCYREYLGYRPNMCTPCRSFVRGVIKTNRKLVCKSKAKDCFIYHDNLSNCSYCRYQKCLKVGLVDVRMDKEPIKDTLTIKQESAEESQPEEEPPELEVHERKMIKKEIIENSVELKRKRLAVACTIAEIEGKFICPDCLIQFDGVRSLFRHLKQPHGEDYHRYSHVNQYGEELDGENVKEEYVDEYDKFERATYHTS